MIDFVWLASDVAIDLRAARPRLADVVTVDLDRRAIE